MNKKRVYIISILLLVLLISSSFFVLFKRLNVPQVIDEPFITLYLHKKNKTINIRVEDYIKGVVAAEMPASFELEALKAQAICARTYAYKKILESHKYPCKADLSDNIQTCQAYISVEEYDKRHSCSEKYLHKISLAVDSTRGIIMTYNNKPIDAVYHSCCGGYTEDAENIWLNKIPYLQSTKCQYCKASKSFTKKTILNNKEFMQALGLKREKNIEIEILDKTRTNRIKKIQINKKTFSGNEIRKLLDLPSTCLKIKVYSEQIEIESRGYGHGVGMCQYGANGMAIDGKTYEDILKKYYKNIKLLNLSY